MNVQVEFGLPRVGVAALERLTPSALSRSFARRAISWDSSAQRDEAVLGDVKQV